MSSNIEMPELKKDWNSHQTLPLVWPPRASHIDINTRPILEPGSRHLGRSNKWSLLRYILRDNLLSHSVCRSVSMCR